MAYSRIKVWIPGEILTASDLNSEFTGCIANDNDLGTKLTAEISARTILESEHDTLAGQVWNTDHIKENTVTNASMADDSVGADEIIALSITDAHIAAANKDGTAATASMRTLGTGALQACAGNDARLSDNRTPPDSSVSQSKLKTSQGSVSVTASSANLTLPGGEYGFYPQVKGAHTNSPYILEASIHSGTTTPTSYTTNIFLSSPTASETGYAQQRYVTSSGEVFWIFILRDKTTKDIIATYQAPDHPCFGNGGKPLITPHPFGNYDPSKHEIIVINPSDEEVFNMQDACIMPEDKADRDILEVIIEDYEIDEDLKTPWTKKEVTVGLPRGIDWKRMKDGTKITPIKKQIPQPDFITTRKLWKK